MKPKNKGFSLRWSLVGIVVGCWLLPMALIMATLIYYTNQSVRRQFDETVHTSISNAAAICRRSMNTAVEASRKASYDGRIRSAYLNYTESGIQQGLYETITSYLRQNYRYNDNFLITLVYLIDNPSNIYYTFNPQQGASYSGVQEYQHLVHDEIVEISKSLDTKIAFVNTNSNVYMIRNIVDSNFNPYAVIVSQLNLDAILGSFRNILWETDAIIYFNGIAVDTVFDSQATVTSPEIPALFPGEQVVVDKGDRIFVFGRESTDAIDIRYSVEVDLRGFLSDFFYFTNIVYLLVFLTIPLLTLAGWFFYRNIFSPIGRFVSASGELQNGHLGYQVNSRTRNREFNYLQDAFNSMSIRIKQQFDHIYNEELALRDARIMALQSQINPHFLNNTLEIINWEVRLGNNAKVSKMIESLSIMLDAAMDRKSSPLVTLAQEIMYVDAYLYIISMRFGKRLTVKKDIDSSLMQQSVPRLIMQPIIENAVEHGVEKKQIGVIEISAESFADGMRLNIKNNSLMSPEDERIIKRLLSPDYDALKDGSLHLGIHNVNLRLKIIYGEKSTLSITRDGECTLASFFVPIDKDKLV